MRRCRLAEHNPDAVREAWASFVTWEMNGRHRERDSGDGTVESDAGTIDEQRGRARSNVHVIGLVRDCSSSQPIGRQACQVELEVWARLNGLLVPLRHHSPKERRITPYQQNTCGLQRATVVGRTSIPLVAIFNDTSTFADVATVMPATECKTFPGLARVVAVLVPLDTPSKNTV